MPIDRTWQFVLIVIGTGILVTYFRSWKTTRRIFYDIPASAVMCAFISQLLLEMYAGEMTAWWWIRVAALVPLTIVPSGRDGLGWPISGHVTTMLAIPLIVMLDGQVWFVEKMLYWIPFPIVLLMHWFIWDREDYLGNTGHKQTVIAVVVGGLIAGATALASWYWSAL